jgi:hypothetical protein
MYLCFFHSSIASLLKVFEAFFHHVLYNPKPDYAACKSLHALLLEKASELLKQTEEGVLDNILRLITNHLRIYKVSCSNLLKSDVVSFVFPRMFPETKSSYKLSSCAAILLGREMRVENMLRKQIP